MNRMKITALVVIGFWSAHTMSHAQAQTVFVNLSNKTANIAQAFRIPGVSPAQYKMVGWWQIPPGGVFRSSAEYARIERNGRPWRPRIPVMWGVYKRGRRFDVGPISGEADAERYHGRNGFRMGFYRKFPRGPVNLPGNEFVVAHRTYFFNERSRSAKSVSHVFRPPGAVAIIGREVRHRRVEGRVHVYWHNRGDRLEYSGQIEGRARGPFGRDHAHFVGSVKIFFTKRR